MNHNIGVFGDHTRLQPFSLMNDSERIMPFFLDQHQIDNVGRKLLHQAIVL